MAQDLHIGQIPELRQFGKNLSQTSGALSTLFNQLGQQMNRACRTWQDEQAQKFMGQFTQKRKEVEKMSHMMLEFSKFINEYCNRAEAAKNVRM
jgi:uncharacterized protein YukE